jgi:hypothetical protein
MRARNTLTRQSEFQHDHQSVKQERRRRRTRSQAMQGRHQKGPQRAHEKDSKAATEEVIRTCTLTNSDRLLIFT